MKRQLIILLSAVLLQTGVFAQDLKFTVIKEMPITSIKNQNSSGTCWSFSAISFLESEAIRMNSIKDEKDYPDFSEMFIVSHSYQDRADKYIRLDGNLTFGAGSSFDDVLKIMSVYGLVPQSAMNGLNYGTELPNHGELDATTLAFVETINKRPNRTLTTAWKNAFKGIVDAYLGECPEKFEFNGKSWTPASFRDSYHLNSDDYVNLTSFTHHPFYTKFAIEVADNWRQGEAYNLPLDEFMQVMYYALENGYTFAWGGDVSEAGFTRKGLAYLKDKNTKDAGSDQEKWVGKDKDKQSMKSEVKIIEPEVTQESRQEGFDNKSTTDDHGMHVFGLAKDQNGKKYFMIKNSWGETGDYKGIWYMTDAFTRAKVLNIVVNKKALPKEIKEKLGIK